MKKKDLLKVAMIGLASGAFIAAQNNTDDLDLNSLLAMSKCSKDQKQDRNSCGSSSCGGGKSSCNSGRCGNGGCDSNGREKTRNEIFGREAKEQKPEDQRCGKFYND